MGTFQDNTGLMFETDDKLDAEVEKHFGQKAPAQVKDYVTTLDLRDMIADRDTYSLADVCDGDMWLSIPMTRLLPDYMPATEIDDFLTGIQQAALAMRKSRSLTAMQQASQILKGKTE